MSLKSPGLWDHLPRPKETGERRILSTALSTPNPGLWIARPESHCGDGQENTDTLYQHLPWSPPFPWETGRKESFHFFFSRFHQDL